MQNFQQWEAGGDQTQLTDSVASETHISTQYLQCLRILKCQWENGRWFIWLVF